MLRILRIKGLRATGNDSATDEFSDSGKDKVGYVSYIDAVECGSPCDAGVDGQDKLAPADGTEPECECTGCHGDEYEFPSAVFEPRHKIIPFDLTE